MPDFMPVVLSTDWTAEYRGVVIGSADSSFAFTEVSGLLDAPAVRTADRVNLNRHGEVSRPDLLGARTVTLTIEVVGRDEAEFADAIADLTRAFAPTLPEDPFSFRFPGVAGGGSRVVYAKVRKRAAPLDWGYTHQLATVAVELYCPDPLIRDALPGTGRATLPVESQAPGTGIRFPTTFPVRFGNPQTADTIRVVNPGTFPTGIRFTVRGPIDNPRIVDLGTGEQLAIRYTLLAGQWLVVDTTTRDVLLNGTAPRFLTPGLANTWLTAPPGETEFGLRGERLDAEAGEPEMTAEWWPAWI